MASTSLVTVRKVRISPAPLPGFDDRQTRHHHVAMHIQPTAPLIDDFHGFLSFRKHFIRNHERSKTSRGCLFLTSFICMLVWQYRVVRPDTWVHLWKASSLALNL